MGCGASNPIQISPVNESVNLTNLNHSHSRNACPSIKFNKFNKTKINNQANGKVNKISIGVQSQDNIMLIDELVQTEYIQYEFGLLGDHLLDDGHELPEHLTEQLYIKSVNFQTELQGKKSTNSLVTVDIGIQTDFLLLNKMVQTKLTGFKLTNMNDVNDMNNQVPKLMKLNFDMKKDSEGLKLKKSISFDNYLSVPLNNETPINKSMDLPIKLGQNLSNQLVLDFVTNNIGDIPSPFNHIEKQLNNENDSFESFQYNNSLSKLLDDIEQSIDKRKNTSVAHVSIQTDNDPITDEAPEFAAKPPSCKKKEMIPSVNMFREIDRRTLEIPQSARSSIENLVNNLCKGCSNDLFKVRSIFRWIANNISFDWKYDGINMNSDKILQSAEGVSKHFSLLFNDLCKAAGIRVKIIEGFAKGHDHRPGNQLKPGEDVIHQWNAVHILSSWRLIDLTWGTGITDHSGKFQRKLNEHFFLTDPEVLIWTHFPYSQVEDDYSRWQLLDKPLSLDEFNSLPKVTPSFFDYNLKIRSKAQSPLSFRVSTEIKIGAHEPMRYKFKLFSTDEIENSSLNYYVFCQLKEDRLIGSFMIQPPTEGTYLFKIFAKPEREMQDTIHQQQDPSSTPLSHVITFLLECTKARKYIEPFPINDIPWGPTQCFYDNKLRFHNQNGPVIVTWGGRRKLVIEGNEILLVSYQVFDSNGMEMDTRNIIGKDDNGNRITFSINPPRVGTFKFVIYGMPKPKQKGKWKLPLLATFLIDCKLAKPVQYDDPVIGSANEQSDERPSSGGKRVKARPIMH